MKTLTVIGCTLGIGLSLSACGADPILLGELIEAAESGDDEPVPDDPTPDAPDANPDLPVPDPNPDPGPAPSDEEIVEGLLLRYCGACHDGNELESAAGLGVIGDIDALIALDRELIVPGSKEDSRIYSRMVAGDMPPVAIESPRPSDEEIELIGQFIDAMD
jgi:hypothetical protein